MFSSLPQFIQLLILIYVGYTVMYISARTNWIGRDIILRYIMILASMFLLTKAMLGGVEFAQHTANVYAKEKNNIVAYIKYSEEEEKSKGDIIKGLQSATYKEKYTSGGETIHEYMIVKEMLHHYGLSNIDELKEEVHYEGVELSDSPGKYYYWIKYYMLSTLILGLSLIGITYQLFGMFTNMKNVPKEAKLDRIVYVGTTIVVLTIVILYAKKIIETYWWL